MKSLPLPQIRILRALVKMPLGRQELKAAAGFTPKSGTLTRHLNGSEANNVVGLLERKLVRVVKIPLDGGIIEEVIDITPKGKRLLEKEKGRKVPKIADPVVTTNHRYQS